MVTERNFAGSDREPASVLVLSRGPEAIYQRQPPELGDLVEYMVEHGGCEGVPSPAAATAARRAASASSLQSAAGRHDPDEGSICKNGDKYLHTDPCIGS